MEKWKQRPGDFAVHLFPMPHFAKLYSQLSCSPCRSLFLPSQWMAELGSGSSLPRTCPTGTPRILSPETSSSSGQKTHMRPSGENRQGCPDKCLGRRRRRKRTLPPFWSAPNQPRNSRSQPSFPDLTGPAHLPTAAQNCKCVSCLPRPHLALLAGTPVSGAVSGRDCWGSICC